MPVVSKDLLIPPVIRGESVIYVLTCFHVLHTSSFISCNDSHSHQQMINLLLQAYMYRVLQLMAKTFKVVSKQTLQADSLTWKGNWKSFICTVLNQTLLLRKADSFTGFRCCNILTRGAI